MSKERDEVFKIVGFHLDVLEKARGGKLPQTEINSLIAMVAIQDIAGSLREIVAELKSHRNHAPEVPTGIHTKAPSYT